MKKDGQAIVEFVVAIVAVIVLVAAMVQIGTLSKIHTDVMAEAREEAGKHAVESLVAGSEAPDYVGSVQNGPDGVNYSADDQASPGNTFDLQSRIVDYAHPGELNDAVGDNMVTEVAASPNLAMDGFVNGHSSKTVQLLPVIQELVSASSSIEVKSDVWMVRLGDIH